MGRLLDDFKTELSTRQNEPGFDKAAFKTEFLASRGHTPKQPEAGSGLPQSRGVIADVVSSVAGGVTDAAEMWGRAVRAFDPKGGNDVVRDFATKGIDAIQGFVDKHPFLKPSKEAESGFRRALTEGTRSFVTSASAVVPGLLAAPVLGAVGVAAGTAAVVAAGAGALGGATVFGAAEKDRFNTEVEDFISSNNLTESQASDLREKGDSAAIKSALVEGGFELAANTLQTITLGLFRPFKGVAKGAVKTTFKSLFDAPVGNVAVRAAKAYGKTAATEVATETAQEALETKFRRDIGITDMSSLEAATSVIAPTLVTSLLFLGAAKGVNSLDKKRIKKGLEEAVDKDGKPVSPFKRKKAVDAAVAVLGKKNKPQAELLRESAYAFIDSGASIDLSTEFGVINYAGQMAKDLNSGALNVHDMAKFANGIQSENEAVSKELTKIANSYKIKNNIPDLQETEQPGGEQDLADTMLNEAKDVDLEAVAAGTDDIADSEEVEAPEVVEKSVDDALAGKQHGLNEDIATFSNAELEAELVSLRENFPSQEPLLGEIQQERIDAVNVELGEREGEAAVKEDRAKVLAEIEEPKAAEPLEPRVEEFKQVQAVKDRQEAQREGIVDPGSKLKPIQKRKLLDDLRALQENVDEAPAVKEGETEGEAQLLPNDQRGVGEGTGEPFKPTLAQVEELAPQGVVDKIRQQIGEDATEEDFNNLIAELEAKTEEPATLAPEGIAEGVRVEAGEPASTAKVKVDEAAKATDSSPTDAQIEAGNAKKGHTNVQGLDISIETAVGQERSGTDLTGKPWTVTMQSHYGYIKGTKGRDKEHLDAFIGKNPGSENVFVVNQINPETGNFDEHKVMLGFDTEEAAKAGYLENYAKGWKGLKSIVPMSMTEFQEWIKGDTTKELKASVEEKVITPAPVSKDITAIQKEANISSDEDLDALLDGIQPTSKKKRLLSATEKGKKQKPKATPSELKEKTAGDILSDASKSGVKGIDSALKGVFELFGGTSLKTFPPTFDEKTYAKAKPHFEQAFVEFGNAGKSLKEFMQFMVNNFGNGIKPYLKFFAQAQREEAPETEVKAEETKPVDVGEKKEKPVKKEKKKVELQPGDPVLFDLTDEDGKVSKRAGRLESVLNDVALIEFENDVARIPIAKVKLDKQRARDKKSLEQKRIRLRDVGEQVPGKRSQKNNFERIKEDMRDLETGNTNKDLNKILNRAVRSKIWKIEKEDRPNATPGTTRYLKAVRDGAMGVNSYVIGQIGQGNFGQSTKKRLEDFAGIEALPGDRKGYNQIAEHVARYENALQILSSATESTNTVQEAHDNIVKLVGKSVPENTKNTMFNLSEEGRAIMDIFPWSEAQGVFRPQKFIEEELKDKPDPKDLRRTKIALSEIERSNLPDHRQANPNPTAQDFINHFGFRAAEFGEYVDSDSGRRHVNHAWDAFHDLTNMLGAPLKASGMKIKTSGFLHGTGESKEGGQVAQGQTLAMAFGSRGRGRHSAHYEPMNHLINMTKNNGDGSLSHEWAHSLDSNLSIAPEGRQAINDVIRSLNTKFNISRAQAEVEEILTGNSRWTRQKIGRTPIEVAREFLKSKWRAYVAVPTNFADKSELLGEYWNRNEEKFARAFEAFTYDTLDGSSPYLVSEWVNGDTTKEENGYRSNPYPAGEEREQFNRIFQHFMDGIEWTEDGIPSMKKDYELVSEKEEKLAQEALDVISGKLEDMFAAMHQGKASKDGLWWYEYTATKRGALMQPADINAHDDGLGENGAVAYTEALLPDMILYYKLKAITHDEDANKVYLKEAGDGGQPRQGDQLDTAGLNGESALEEVETEDGQRADTGAGVPRSPTERTGEESDGNGERGTSGDASAFGDGESAADVDTAASGIGGNELKSGQDAVLGGGNYRITESDRVGQGTLNEKFSGNISAIRTLKLIEQEERQATREEQAVLVKYVGWGGMSNAFNQFGEKGWTDKFEILNQALTEDEFAAARTSTLSSFYTSPEVVTKMYDALQKFGFKGGRVLEPAVGTGNFFGLLPESIAGETQLAGVEMDNISSRIAKQLYQRANVFNSPYEKSTLPRNFYDVAISNVPFEDVIPFDKTYNKKRMKLHDYYFNKTLALVRPGGIVAFVTSAGTMDKVNTEARKQLAKEAEFVGAIRLPDTAFQDAGTKVTADIIFLRRKGGTGKAIKEQGWLDLATYEQQEPGKSFSPQSFQINEYFAKNPEMMLGQMSNTGRWENSQSLMTDGRNIEEALTEAVDKLPTDIYAELENVVEVDIADLIPNEGEFSDGDFFEENGKVFTFTTGEEAKEYEENTPHQKRKARVIKGFIKIRAARRAMLKAQAKEESEKVQKPLTKKLNVVYDAFVKEFGFLNQPENLRAFITDPEAPRILALENWNDELGEAEKSDIFSKKFIENLRPVTSVKTPRDGIPHSLNALGRVDIPFIANLAGVTENEAIAELQGEVWNDPEKGWVVADEYLSGNIKEKIALAEQAAKSDATFKKNVDALTPLIPEDLPPSAIRANLGAPWIEPRDVQQFIRDLVPQGFGVHVDYVPEIGLWKLTSRGGGSDAGARRLMSTAKDSVAATATWGTSRKNFFDLLEKYILNGSAQGLTVFDTVGSGKEATKILNTKETEAAQAKLEAIKEKFSKWVWEDDARLQKYVRKYNDVYNATVERKFDGSHLTFPGQVPDDIIKLTSHQKNAVWRAVSTGFNTYFAHEVGTGKTFAMAATIMEAKRLGLKKKPLLLGVKANVDALAEDFARLYPTARILRMDVSANALKRKIQLNRIANNEWDAVIISHDSFKNIQLSAEGQAEAVEEEMGNLRLSLAGAQESGAAQFTIKAIEKRMSALKADLDKRIGALAESKIDLDFEELGMDMIVVDEAHIFKNIPYATKLDGIVGVSGDGSGKAFDLHMKTRWINEKFGGGIILASGTPITNSVSEIYNIGRYLNPQTLRDKGIHTFDAWAAAFGNITQTAEFAPEGGGYRMVRKFKEFFNIPELRSIVREVVDVIAAKTLNLKVPGILTGKPIPVVIPQNPMVEALSQEMLMRAKDIRSGGINKQPRHPDKTDIMFSIINDGRNGAIDMRLVDPALPDHADTKANYAVKNIFQLWKASKDMKGTQLVFADRGVPSKGKLKKPFNVYDDIKGKLIRMGIPEKEIAFPRDVKGNKLKKKRLFNQVNAGDVRILIGSTADMGIGVNIQERGVGLHNLDTEWTFERLEQRRGRFVRRGNILYDKGLPVSVFNYMTEGTVDAFMWDKVANKKITTEVVLQENSQQREVEDVSQESASHQEMMAFASGDPRFQHKIELEAEVRKLNAIRGNFVDERARLVREKQAIPGVIEAMNTSIANKKQAADWFDGVNAVRIGDTLFDLKRHATELNKKMAEILSPKRIKPLEKNGGAKVLIATFGHATTEEVETAEEVTTVKTVKDIKALKKGVKLTQKGTKIKVNKVLRWEGNNDVPVYVRMPLVLGTQRKATIDVLKIGTKSKYGEWELTASGGLARLLANTKLAIERESKESQELIEKKVKQGEDIDTSINKPFDQEQEHTDKTEELQQLVAELQQILQQQQEEQGQIDPDLERFKSGAKDVGEMDIPEEKVSLSLQKKTDIKAKESEYWAVTGQIAQAIVDQDDVTKERLEKTRSKIEGELSKATNVKASVPTTKKVTPTGVLADIYNDVFAEAEKILGYGKVKLEPVTQEALKADPGVLKAAEELGISKEELIEEHNVKGAYQNVVVDGVAVKGIIKVAADGVQSVINMEQTVRHEVFHGVFQRLLNKKDRNIILERYKTEEKAADAFATHLTGDNKLVPTSARNIFNRLVDFFQSLGNLLKGRGFKNAGDIFGAAAAGELADKATTSEAVGGNVSLSIEKGVPEEDLNAEHLTSKLQYEKSLKSDNPLLQQYAAGLQNVVTMNPVNVMGNKSHTKVVDEIYANVRNTDIKWHERMFSLPWHLAKKFTEWKMALGVEIKREEDRNLINSEFRKKVGEVQKGEKDIHEILNLKAAEEEDVLLAIYEGDALNKEFTNDELNNSIAITELNKLDPGKFSKKNVKLSPSQISAYKAWQASTKKMRDRLVEAIDKLTYLEFQNKPWLEKLKATVKRHEMNRSRQRKAETETGKRTDFSELSESEIPQRMKESDRKEFIDAFNKILPKQIRISTLRRQMGEIKGYAPRVREGRFVVKAYDTLGNTLWHERTEKEKETRGMISSMIKRLEAQGFKHGQDFTVRKEVSDKTSEFIFDQIQAVSVERFVNKAINQAKTNEKISEADVAAVTEEMITLLTNEFKQRGFASAMMKRRTGFPIGGYKIENIKKRYSGYVGGASGYITKQIAAFEYASVLRTIDINSKPDLYEDIARYSGDMLRNSTRLDRVSGRVRTAAFVWYLAGQLKSPIVNFTQNWILGIPLLEKATGKGAKGIYHGAMADVARRKYTDTERKFLKEMQERGITGDQLTQEITGNTTAEAGKIYEGVIKVLATPFSLSEIYNRKVTGLAMFRAAIKAGDDYRTAFDKSRKFIIDVHFLYGKLNAPAGARGGTPGAAILRTSLTFRNYTFNFILSMKDMLSEGDFKTVAKAMTYMALLGGASALPFLDGLIDMLERVTGVPWRKNVKKELENVGGEVFANVGVQGLPALVGADIGGSLRIHFPDVTQPGKLIEESVFGVYEGLAMKAVNSVKAASTGQIARSFELLSPTFIERPLKAIREHRTGLTTTRGKIIKESSGAQIMPTVPETIATAFSFRPSRIARLSDNYRQFGNIKKFYSDWRGDIYTKFRLSKTAETRQKVLQEVIEYNRAAIDQGGAVSLIGASQLKGALKDRADKRFAAFGGVK